MRNTNLNIFFSGLHSICYATELGMVLNATKIRHRVSTIYASLDMAAADREIYLQHMSHSDNVSKENYRCPPGKRELEVMAPLLEDIAKGTFDL